MLCKKCGHVFKAYREPKENYLYYLYNTEVTLDYKNIFKIMQNQSFKNIKLKTTLFVLILEAMTDQC